MIGKLFRTAAPQNRWAIILAGGEGVRLQSFVHKLRGDSLPKQYVNLFGDHSMLEATLRRADKLIPPDRQFVVVTESHFEYVEVAQQLANFPNVGVATQPANRDTGWGLLLALAHIYQRYADATVAIFPSDHFIQEEDLFLAHVDAAWRLVDQDPSKIVLLGVAPNGPETDYGYIIADHHWRDAFPFGARGVASFIEKPQPVLARKLMLQGGFWNTMVTVFNLKTLLEHVRAICPASFACFERIYRAAGGGRLTNVVKQVFEQVEPMNFSRVILQKLAASRERALLVLPVRGVHWSDWGTEERIIKTLAHTNNCAQEIPFGGAPLNSSLKRNLAG
ncbi:MAG TPA: sugar phosphate nucleotidyltransferase [Acidobacteriota bacterium]|nr:sugar phosphate nucleotidyltransferase [Acidobacteriota bacterium]